MASDYDKKEWQAEQAARDAALEKQRDKEKKTRERSARNAKRKLERLRQKLSEAGELTEWEDEFSESVTERLEKFGSAFQDREKGRPGDALSFAQKRVVSSLKAKARGKDKGQNEMRRGNGFKTKQKFQPRVRHIEDDLPTGTDEQVKNAVDRPMPKRPFLRVVK